MPAHTDLLACRSFKPLAALGLAALLGACASPQESAIRYDTSRENTQRDAQSHAMAGGPSAASQVQLGFGDTGPAPVQAPRSGTAAAGAATGTEGAGSATGGGAGAGSGTGTDTGAVSTATRPLAEARSFLGTVPCPSGFACEASRFTVTLAPSGEWRARTVLLVNNQPSQALVDHGCWQVIGDAPMRIALMHAGKETSKGDFTFVNNNTLRVNTLNGVQPLLEHRLTRQADVDGIDEFQGQVALSC